MADNRRRGLASDDFCIIGVLSVTDIARGTALSSTAFIASLSGRPLRAEPSASCIGDAAVSRRENRSRHLERRVSRRRRRRNASIVVVRKTSVRSSGGFQNRSHFHHRRHQHAGALPPQQLQRRRTDGRTGEGVGSVAGGT